MLDQFKELLNHHAALISELQARHAGRPYHNWDHILAILSLASRYPHLINDIEAFFWMAVFHDVIYHSDRQDNEEKSAAAARERLILLISESRLILVCLGISATAKHKLPDGLNLADEQDISFFLDCDLSILGTDSGTFRAYDAAIREEYSWVQEPQWRTGRAGVMKRFLERETIYFTSEMRKEFEGRARHNIKTLIEELSLGKGN
jgi:predicted metal-dependent HD superfamily phosphohydrolase